MGSRFSAKALVPSIKSLLSPSLRNEVLSNCRPSDNGLPRAWKMVSLPSCIAVGDLVAIKLAISRHLSISED